MDATVRPQAGWPPVSEHWDLSRIPQGQRDTHGQRLGHPPRPGPSRAQLHPAARPSREERLYLRSRGSIFALRERETDYCKVRDVQPGEAHSPEPIRSHPRGHRPMPDAKASDRPFSRPAPPPEDTRLKQVSLSALAQGTPGGRSSQRHVAERAARECPQASVVGTCARPEHSPTAPWTLHSREAPASDSPDTGKETPPRPRRGPRELPHCGRVWAQSQPQPRRPVAFLTRRVPTPRPTHPGSTTLGHTAWLEVTGAWPPGSDSRGCLSGRPRPVAPLFLESPGVPGDRKQMASALGVVGRRPEGAGRAGRCARARTFSFLLPLERPIGLRGAAAGRPVPGAASPRCWGAPPPRGGTSVSSGSTPPSQTRAARAWFLRPCHHGDSHRPCPRGQGPGPARF